MSRKLEFKNFDEAWDFMSLVALKAKALDHHPDWFNVYNRVNINLNTHDAGGLSKNDMVLAQFINISEQAVRNNSKTTFSEIESRLSKLQIESKIDSLEKN